MKCLAGGPGVQSVPSLKAAVSCSSQNVFTVFTCKLICMSPFIKLDIS